MYLVRVLNSPRVIWYNDFIAFDWSTFSALFTSKWYERFGHKKVLNVVNVSLFCFSSNWKKMYKW